MADERDDEQLFVEDVLEPVSHRLGPDAPLQDVIDLIVGRRVGAVPIVGEGGEVLGIITTALVSGSASNRARASMKVVPMIGSPPMPRQVVWPIPSRES